MTSKNLIDPTVPFKYQLKQLIIHKSGGVYIVTGLPDEYRIEATTEPAYTYRKLNDAGEPVGCNWVRAQSVMEDEGRFIAADKDKHPWLFS